MTGLTAYCFFSLPSTQDFLAKKLRSTHEGDFVVSRIQTSGKGRQGRSWRSDEGGLYFSITLVPRLDSLVDKITTMLADSVLHTLQNDFFLEGCTLKFPNDVLCNGKKIAGILADANLKGKTSTIYCGIGVNLNNGKSWDEELREKATSYFLEKGRLISEDDFLVVLVRRIDEEYCRLIYDPSNQTKYTRS